MKKDKRNTKRVLEEGYDPAAEGERAAVIDNLVIKYGIRPIGKNETRDEFHARVRQTLNGG